MRELLLFFLVNTLENFLTALVKRLLASAAFLLENGWLPLAG
jgi:hypothetical protein